VRFSIIARSLGVILASPLLALPLGFAGESSAPLHAGTARLSDQVVPPAAAPATPAVRPSSTVFASRAVPGPVTEEVEVTVSCATDGCVVSTGLDVVVVAAPPRR
jgi:hypothetical protein